MSRGAINISVQGWGSWLGDQAKSLALTLLLGAPVLLLFNWIVRRWPRRYWFGIWLATLPLLVVLHLRHRRWLRPSSTSSSRSS